VRVDERLRVLIADDEVLARERIRDLLLKADNVDIVGSTDNGKATLAAIHSHEPDLLFLDVQMPGMNGFEVVRKVGPENMPATIFVTAYDKHALKAFDLAAIDYLLKPFSDERFEKALERARQLCQLRQYGDVVGRIRQAMETMGVDTPDTRIAPREVAYLERIAVESRGQVRVVAVEQIDYIGACGVYAELHVGEKAYVVRERMQLLEERLDPRHFFRVHRSAIVQLNRIDLLLREAGGDYTLKLKNGAQLTVSRSRIRNLEAWMGVPRHGTQP
jgi:two-component system, LytTR family, response regulator